MPNNTSPKGHIILGKHRNQSRGQSCFFSYLWPRFGPPLGYYLAAQLTRHRIVISQTDTIPGLLCQLNDNHAIDKIYTYKGRSEEKALPSLAANITMALDFCPSGFATESMKKFLDEIWPGPITCILPLRQIKGCLALANKSNFAVRVPGHHQLRQMISKLGQPIIATSANLSGQGIPSNIQKILAIFGKQVGFYHFELTLARFSRCQCRKKLKKTTSDKLLDNDILSDFMQLPIAGQGEIASTIIDLTGYSPKLLRQGAIPFGHILAKWSNSKTNL